LLALIARPGLDAAITPLSPRARVMAYADAGVVRHEARTVRVPCQQVLKTWRADSGLTRNEDKSQMRPTLDGAQPGFAVFGFHIRQYRVGPPQAGKRPHGHQRLGYTTRIKPAKAHSQAPLAERGRVIQRGKALPQGALMRPRNPTIRGWAHSYRPSVRPAVCARLEFLLGEKLRSGAQRRHPNKTAPWAVPRYRRGVDTRLTCATPATAPDPGHLHTPSEVMLTRHVKVTGHRSPYEGDWVYWRSRRGRYPTVNTRLAKLLQRQRGRCVYCGLFFQQEDRLEMDHISGDRQDSRYANLQALHGHCHDAKTREHGDYLPVGMRDK